MPITPSRHDEIEALVNDLRGEDRVASESAYARLVLLGSRAVERLVEELEGQSGVGRGRVIRLLSQIGDRRAVSPMLQIAREGSEPERVQAVEALAAFPGESVAVALQQELGDSRDGNRRRAILETLLSFHVRGHMDLEIFLLERLQDAEEGKDARLALLRLTESMSSSAATRVLKKLARDPTKEIAIAAGQRLNPDSAASARPSRKVPVLLSLLANAGSPEEEAEAIAALARAGSESLAPVLEAIRARNEDVLYCARLGTVLKKMGPGVRDAVHAELSGDLGPAAIETLAEVVSWFRDKTSITPLKDLQDRLSDQLVLEKDPDRRRWIRKIKAGIHLTLARMGSYIAVQDLMRDLRQSEVPRPELIQAARLIGGKDSLPGLLIQYRAGRTEFRTLADEISETIRIIMKREKIRRNNQVILALGEDAPDLIEEILAAGKSRSPRPRKKKAAAKKKGKT